MQKEFSLLAETIKDICGNEPTFYLANPGNWGDAVIRHGTKVFLKQKGIKYNEIMISKTMEIMNKKACNGGVLLYGGGGAWSKLWNHGYEIINKIKQNFAKIIILPSTFAMNFSIPHATFFCRDIFESKNNIKEAIFCHDMAFFIGKLHVGQGVGTGSFFRLEAESSGRIDIPPHNSDISLEGNHFSDIGPFFAEIAKYETIHTDRLHVAIASCLLGRKLHFYAGSYFKNKAVYLSSMKDYYLKAQFHEM